MVENMAALHGRLETVPLREVWTHEALDFTPWLLANADLLGNALDMDLEIDAAEHPVGGFSLDLLGRDCRTNDSVIIENQLESTDHCHLGQLLTYAGGTDAVNIVWVAREFREEHRAALDWLNARTNSVTRFFGVEVSVVRIGDSLPAPLFRVIAKPNGWGKAIRNRVKDGTVTARDELYGEFWDRYIAALREVGLEWTRATKGPRQNWFPTSSGVSGAEFTVSFGRYGRLSEVYFGHPDPAVNTFRFQRLRGARENLERDYGDELLFESLEARKGCRIGDRSAGGIVDRDDWADHIDWFVGSQRRLRSAVTAAGGIPDAPSA